MKRIYRWGIMGFLTGLILFSCSPGERYERRLVRELASGVRNDSLFMGIYLGMTEKEFYSHCWNLNRQGLVRQGTGNTSVEYDMREELNFPATMNFYPVFNQGRIMEMPVRFIYNGWAPWNKELSAESLMLDVLNWCEDIYGHGFIKAEHPEKGTAYVKIDGNRRISIYTEQDRYVWTVFRDMLAEDYDEKNSSDLTP
jgi:hypothetical protein